MWDLLFKTPILNILFLFYRILFSNMGLAIIALTLLFRVVLIPLTLPAMRSSKKIKELQPQLDKLKEKNKGDQAALAREQMELYRDHGVNPAAGCLPIFLSIPVMVALYQVLLQALDASALEVLNQKIYFDFLRIGGISQLHTFFLWLDLTKPDRFFILPVLVGVCQYLNSLLISPTLASDTKQSGKSGGGDEMAAMMQSQFKYMFPLMTTFITLRLPAGVALYWLVSTLFGIMQAKFFT
ncbi:YidC/Oxa1 family membrane protein insertase [Patescibacteria group bacterium]|nr:YidC/Oxa1 family membrane protein insertase [Patescibacteria group bacterium]MBU1868617.1 YidC/Oxa1 family membrane protein insertase [Patescibacteria group bacterium]